MRVCSTTMRCCMHEYVFLATCKASLLCHSVHWRCGLRKTPSTAPQGVQAQWYCFAKPAPVYGLLLRADAEAANARPASQAADFAMNPNTGALVPAAPAAAHSRGSQQPSPGSLLGTPALAHSSPSLDPSSRSVDQRRASHTGAPAAAAPPCSPLLHPGEPFKPPSPKYGEASARFFTPAPLPVCTPAAARAAASPPPRGSTPCRTPF